MSMMTLPMQGMTPPIKLYRVGEIVRFTGLSRQTVHNYTVMGLIREAEWTPGGHRLYDEQVFGRLQQIQSLKKSKNMLEIQRLISEQTIN